MKDRVDQSVSWQKPPFRNIQLPQGGDAPVGSFKHCISSAALGPAETVSVGDVNTNFVQPPHLHTLYLESDVRQSTESERPAPVLMIYTGGTLGMIKDASGAYVAAPALLERLMELHPQLMSEEMPDIHVISFNPPLDSSAITPHHWTLLVRLVANHYEDYSGFVIAHGTDTLSYTASALSFAFDRLTKPVVVTGSQIPLSVVRNDALTNLVDALLVASRASIPEVLVVFDSKILRGNRSTKHNCFGRDAFSSPNYGPIGSGGTRLVFNPRRVRSSPCAEDDTSETAAELSHHEHRAADAPKGAVCSDVASPIASASQCTFSEDVIILRVFPGAGDFISEVIESCAERMEAHASVWQSKKGGFGPRSQKSEDGSGAALASPIPRSASQAAAVVCETTRSVAVVLSDGTLGATEAHSEEVRLFTSSTRGGFSHDHSPCLLKDVDINPEGQVGGGSPPVSPLDAAKGEGGAPRSSAGDVNANAGVPRGLLRRLNSISRPSTTGPLSPLGSPVVSPVVSMTGPWGDDSRPPTQPSPSAPSPTSHTPCSQHPRRWTGLDPSQRVWRGIVLTAYGSGTVPPDEKFVEALSRATKAGVVIVVVTVCQIGEVVLSAYAASSGLVAAGVVSGSDMTVEAAFTKLSHLLAQPQGVNPEWVRERLQCNLRGEMFDQRAKSKSTSVSALATKVAIF